MHSKLFPWSQTRLRAPTESAGNAIIDMCELGHKLIERCCLFTRIIADCGDELTTFSLPFPTKRFELWRDFVEVRHIPEEPEELCAILQVASFLQDDDGVNQACTLIVKRIRHTLLTSASPGTPPHSYPWAQVAYITDHLKHLPPADLETVASRFSICDLFNAPSFLLHARLIYASHTDAGTLDLRDFQMLFPPSDLEAAPRAFCNLMHEVSLIPTLRRICLPVSYFCTDLALVNSISQQLKPLTNITALHQDQPPAGCVPMSPMLLTPLLSHLPQLASLQFYVAYPQHYEWQSITCALTRQLNLRCLSLSDCQLTESLYVMLLDTVASLTNLTALDMPRPPIDFWTSPALKSSFNPPPQLVHLKCPILSPDAHSTLTALSQLSCLASLSLEWGYFQLANLQSLVAACGTLLSFPQLKKFSCNAWIHRRTPCDCFVAPEDLARFQKVLNQLEELRVGTTDVNVPFFPLLPRLGAQSCIVALHGMTSHQPWVNSHDSSVLAACPGLKSLHINTAHWLSSHLDRSLDYTTQISSVEIHCDRFRCAPEGAAVAKVLSLPSLQRLEVHFNSWSLEEWLERELPAAQLSRLVLSCYRRWPFTAMDNHRASRVLGRIVKHQTSLRELQLQGVGLSITELSSLSGMASLQVLHVCVVCRTVTVFDARTICQRLSSLEKLRDLEINFLCDEVNPGVAEALGSGLRGLHQLQSLSIFRKWQRLKMQPMYEQLLGNCLSVGKLQLLLNRVDERSRITTY